MSKEKFIEIYNANIERKGAAKLLAWLEKSDFFTAPASTKHHLAYEGGLVEHSVNVFNRFECENQETRAICSLLHDLCKVNFYKSEWKNQKVYCENGSKKDEGGKFEWQTIKGYSVDDQLPYGHGEKSIYIISKFMHLSLEESMAVRWHMGGFDDSVKGGSYSMSGAFEKYPIAVNLHIADLQATYLDEKRKDNENN